MSVEMCNTRIGSVQSHILKFEKTPLFLNINMVNRVSEIMNVHCNIVGLAQLHKTGNSIADILESHQSCAKPSNYLIVTLYHQVVPETLVID